ncbi:MAG: glucokinase, partial [Spirochaetales bacterium]
VQDNFCRMTNVNWEIKGLDIEAFLGARTLIINDFLALSYALPLLDVSKDGCVKPLLLPNGTIPSPSGSIRAVIGAGTGLGVGFLVEDHGKYLAIPSEGGHVEWAAGSREFYDLYDFIQQTEGMLPEAEHVISGPGIGRIFRYLQGNASKHALSLPTESPPTNPKELPAWVASNSATEPLCNKAMELFVKAYARFACNIALTFLPTAGLYLAGGIAAKNATLFEADHLFTRTFLTACRESHRKLLESIPLYIITDYSVSLLGAAHAAYSLL